MTPDERKQRIESLIIRRNLINRELVRLKKTCPHELQTIQNEELVCMTCDHVFGWSCEHSPDGICHYDCEIEGRGDYGEITLLNGKKVVSPDTTDTYQEDCMYCGQPSERK